MYNSPITILTTELAQRVVNRMEDGIYEAVVSYDIQVDKGELLRALQYDRAQYETGYSDGFRDGYKERDRELVRCKDCIYYGDSEYCPALCLADYTNPDDFCCWAERRESDG